MNLSDGTLLYREDDPTDMVIFFVYADKTSSYAATRLDISVASSRS